MDGITLPEKAKRTAKAAAEGAASWLTQIRGLRSALSALTNPETSAFEERAVLVDADIAAEGAAARGAALTDYSVAVLALARGQENVSYELAALAPSVAGAGTHFFQLRAVGRIETPTIAVASGDSNSAMLAKLADAINGAAVGVTAAIELNPKAGTQRLTAAADRTGAAGFFSLSDSSGSVIAATGVGTVAVEASDAVYRINGGPVLRSPDNEVLLQNSKVELRLQAATSSAAVAVVPDGRAIARQLGEVVRQANELNDLFESASGFLHESLRESIDEALDGPSAKWLGIHSSADRRWRLDEDKLLAGVAERPNHVRRLAVGPGGVADALLEALTRFERMPAESLLDASADGFHSYMAYQASLQPYLQLQLNGVFVDSSQ